MCYLLRCYSGAVSVSMGANPQSRCKAVTRYLGTVPGLAPAEPKTTRLLLRISRMGSVPQKIQARSEPIPRTEKYVGVGARGTRTVCSNPFGPTRIKTLGDRESRGSEHGGQSR